MNSGWNIGFMQGRLSPLRNGRIQSFPWEDWTTEFEKAKDAKFELMEWTIDGEDFPLNPLVDAICWKKIEALCKEFQVSIPSVTCDYYMESPSWKNDSPTVRNSLISILDGMAKVGARILVIPLVDNSSLKESLEIDSVREFFLELTPELATRNIQIAFESDFCPSDLANFISSFNEEQFGINYDIGNSASYGFSPKDEFAAYGSRIINVHVKDRKLGGTTVPLGQGNADFEMVIRMLFEHDYHGNLILQTARASDDRHLEVLISYKQMVTNWMENQFHV